jgi:CARDB
LGVGGAYCDGDYYSFTVTIQNDGASDRFKVKGGGAFANTRYFKGTANITSQVKAGTYQTASLAAGAKTTITVRIDPNYAESALVTLTSVADPTKKDAVKAVLKRSACTC